MLLLLVLPRVLPQVLPRVPRPEAMKIDELTPAIALHRNLIGIFQ